MHYFKSVHHTHSPTAGLYNATTARIAPLQIEQDKISAFELERDPTPQPALVSDYNTDMDWDIKIVPHSDTDCMPIHAWTQMGYSL